MIRLFATVCITLCLSVWHTTVQAADQPAAQWIWQAGDVGEKQVIHARKSIQVEGQIKSVRVAVSSDNHFSLLVNGNEVASGSSWNPPVGEDITDAFQQTDAGQPGSHLLALRAANEGGPAGLLLVMEIETTTGKQWVVSDESWKITGDAPGEGWQTPAFDDATWASAHVLGPVGQAPWTAVTPEVVQRSVQLKEPAATLPETLRVKKDFRVELLYSVPAKRQGSWVNLCADPKGRLIVSDQYGDLFRVTPGPVGSTDEALVEPIAVELGEAQGLLWAFDALYVVVNGGGKYQSGLYRVRDTNGDDQLDQVEQLKAIQGGGEHGPHAVVLSPAGNSLIVVCGNSTALIECNDSRVPRHWSEDLILPRMPDGNGFMAGVLAPGGCIYETDPDGKAWTLLSTGFRNQYDAAFNKFGDLFSYDADMEWDMNTPWYRPTRVCQVSSGSEWGWRNGAGKWPAHWEDTLPPVVNVGPGSPTGVCFGYGAKFPARYQDAYFICDWSYGKLYAVHMNSAGAGYTGELEEFVTGTPLPLTDVIVNPVDRAMYFLIGGRRVKSGLYRVTYTGAESTEPVSTAVPLQPAQALRQQLEQLHRPVGAAAVEQAWTQLGSNDRFLRFAARTALEHQPAELWTQRALAETNPLVSLDALLALVRTTNLDEHHRAKDALPVDEDLKRQVFEALLRIEWSPLAVAQRMRLVRVVTVACTRLDEPTADQRQQLIDKFDAVFPAESRELNVDLANLLIYLEAPSAAAKTVALLEQAPTQEEQIDLARALRVLETGWTPELRTQYFQWFLKSRSYKGGNSFANFVKNIAKDALENVDEADRATFQAILDTKTDDVAVSFAQPTRPIVQQWKLEELAPSLATGLSGGRNYDRGRTMFAAANCFACHRFDNEGGAVGPDLSGVAGRFSPRDLLESVMDPSKTVSDQYEAVNIQTVDGKVVSGRIVNLNGDALIVMPNMLDPNNLVHVDRNNVDVMEASKVSMMPTGLLNTLHQEEVLDLMAYMLSRGDRNHPVFAQ